LGGCICREVGGVYVEKGGVHVIVPFVNPYIVRAFENRKSPVLGALRETQVTKVIGRG